VVGLAAGLARSCGRTRLGPRWRTWLGICAAILTAGWPAQPTGSTGVAAPGAGGPGSSLLSMAGPGADDPGTITVLPGSVQAATAGTLTFTYTASASLPPVDVTVTLTVPTGWTAPTTSPGPGDSTVSCAKSDCLVTTSSTAIMVSFNLDVVQTFMLTYSATAPGVATTSIFSASEQLAGKPPTTLQIPPPEVIVTCPDGQGTMNVSPSAATAGSVGTLKFGYTAGSCGVGTGGAVTLTVPSGWTPPTTTPGAPGLTTSTGGTPSISGMTITVPTGPLPPAGTFSIDYEMATAPGSAASYPFGAAERSSAGGILTSLPVSPDVNVRLASAGSASPTQSSPTQSSPTQSSPTQETQVAPPPVASMAVSPAQVLASRPSTLTFTYTAPRAGLSPSGEITIEVPAGWAAPSASPGQAGYASSAGGLLSVSGRRITVHGATVASGQNLTITYTTPAAPSSAGRSTFVSSERLDSTATLTALTLSPSVTVALVGPAGGSGPWLAILLTIGLAAAAASAGVLTRRRVRQHGRMTVGQSVSASPHAGAPASVAIHDIGARPTLIVRIEPHDSATVTMIKKARP
jgi:hypothetical protein